MSQSSLTEHVTPIEAGAEVVGIAFLGAQPVFALANGDALLADKDSETRVKIHEDGAILTCASDGKKLYTGGDDGKVFALDAAGKIEALGQEKGWIDALAARDSAVAWSSGKTVRARDAKGEVKTFTAPSSVRGLAHFPKGYRLAVAHYGGASLWFPNVQGGVEALAWKGSHLDVTLAPDARFVVTSMQENSLHGWRLSDKNDMRMSGYPAKSRSLSWSHDGQWLATSGAEGCIVWPFAGKDGPMGKAPRECGVRSDVLVTATAFHPGALVVAIGYDDGWIMLVRLVDAAEILVRRVEGARDPVTALSFAPKGGRLAFGTRGGAAGVLDFPNG